MSKWEPTQYDLQWLKSTLTRLKNGGVWASSYYTIRKIDEKTFEFDHLNKDHPDFKFHYQAIKKVMAKVGWILSDPIK